ncbi:hypothetical protein [Saccharopolyspora phatthalungensis]|uniref:Uncharacterized membrane protein HdeD (DUF308 family) n=1 Tax=Saccharopolyspora phatthalungensis TaxID=664693 RepID=A0A840Q8J8_9PSEU|nr:hypothetical protein [Saccharopolyspora phatthalungensis]MBB5157064.1 uncharacterized membrane protein HdeD (DUF308 family) [Saccharopolyspora phatthalungensis]
MLSSVATAFFVFLVVVMPRNGRIRLRTFVAAAFVVLGESGVAFGATGDLLQNALLYLAAGLLFLAEMATSPRNLLIPVLWIVGGIVSFVNRDEIRDWADSVRPWVMVGGVVGALGLGALAAARQRRISRPPYDPHDMTGI